MRAATAARWSVCACACNAIDWPRARAGVVLNKRGIRDENGKIKSKLRECAPPVLSFFQSLPMTTDRRALSDGFCSLLSDFSCDLSGLCPRATVSLPSRLLLPMVAAATAKRAIILPFVRAPCLLLFITYFLWRPACAVLIFKGSRKLLLSPALCLRTRRWAR